LDGELYSTWIFLKYGSYYHLDRVHFLFLIQSWKNSTYR